MPAHVLAYQDKTFHLPPFPKFTISMNSCMKFICLNMNEESEVSSLAARSALLGTGIFAELSSWITNPSIIVGLNALDIIYLMVDSSAENRIGKIAMNALCIWGVGKLNQKGGLDELSQFFSQHASSASKDLQTLQFAKDSDPVFIGKIPSLPVIGRSRILHFLFSTINQVIESITSFFTRIFNGIFGAR